MNRTKIAEVTLNALRTRQSLVKGERLVRHEMRAVLSVAARHNSGRPRTVARAGKLCDNLTQFFLRRCQRTLANAEPALLGPLRLIGRLLPKRVCHTLQKCKAEATIEQPAGKPNRNCSPKKIDVTRKLPVGSVSVVTLIRTDTTLDHSQKAEKVCTNK